MQIDVTERIETAKRLTAEWSDRAGYKKPPVETDEHSKKARDLARIMGVSSFGCQQRNVQAILECLIGESIPVKASAPSEYLSREPFVVGSVLVPVRAYGGEGSRPGRVTRISQSGNAGLQMSNGVLHNNHFQQHDLRPATDEEIDAYFAEFFGLATNPADVPHVPGETVADDELNSIDF